MLVRPHGSAVEVMSTMSAASTAPMASGPASSCTGPMPSAWSAVSSRSSDSRPSPRRMASRKATGSAIIRKCGAR